MTDGKRDTTNKDTGRDIATNREHGFANEAPLTNRRGEGDRGRASDRPPSETTNSTGPKNSDK